jgi:hypothetical protein
VLGNGVLRGIFGPKKGETTGEWRKLHNEEVYNLYFPRNIIRVIQSKRLSWAGHVARMGDRRCVYRGLAGRDEEKRPRERARRI